MSFLIQEDGSRMDMQARISRLSETKRALLAMTLRSRNAEFLKEDKTHSGKRLVAYLTAAAAQRPDPNELRRFLSETLPAHMIPSRFVFLDEMPLTPNGKVDRKALATLVSKTEPPPSVFLEAETELEEQLADIWQAALGVEKVGRDDNFFDLGGHSLLAARIHMQLQRVLKRKLSVIELFRYPTIRSLAKHLGSREPKRDSPGVVPGRVTQHPIDDPQSGKRSDHQRAADE